MWGEDGDDIYQVVTDRLPQTKAAQRRVGEAAKKPSFPPTPIALTVERESTKFCIWAAI